LPDEHAFDVEAIDGNPAGLAVARETAVARGLSVSLHNGFADSLPYPDAHFDYVLSLNVIHHGTPGDLGRWLGEIRVRRSDNPFAPVDWGVTRHRGT
jgi:ubiquinone/menaquinone biosynthesis C-methylase UbiE